MLGWDPVDLVGANLERWTHPDDLPDGINDPLATLARESCERVEFGGRYLDSHGQVIHTLATAASYLDEDAHRVAILQVLDISERKRLEEQLGHLASHDPLTGLFNRRRLAEELDRELTRVRRYPGRGAVLALDFDGFKFVNDTLGHAAGDRLVASLADSMKRTLRASETIARTGGSSRVLELAESVTIDGEFVERLPENRADQLLVKAVAEVARGLGAETIAEFVQDDETVALLHELGVGYAQGHHTGRPGPLDDILPSLQPVAR
jgi:diguanylate cyclase (GGDEF)-like protein/PAS domain S-box-containing protein